MLCIRARSYAIRSLTPSTCVTLRHLQRCHIHTTTSLLAGHGPRPELVMENDETEFRKLIDAAILTFPEGYKSLGNGWDESKDTAVGRQHLINFVRGASRREWITWRKQGGRDEDAQKPLLVQYFAERMAKGTVSKDALIKMRKALRETEGEPEDEGLWLPPADQAMGSSFDFHNAGLAWDATESQPRKADTASSLPSSVSWMTLQQRLRTQDTAFSSETDSAVPNSARKNTDSKSADKPKKSRSTSQSTKAVPPPKAEVKVAGIEMLQFKQHDIALPQGDIEGADGIPRLAHNLDRTLFDPGVHVMQDLRSDVYNFDPYLSTLPPNSKFDFEALGEFVSASRDKRLRELVQEKKHKYCGSTSSLSSILSHFHYLLSGWRKLNFDNISRSWNPPSENFTQIVRRPAASFAKFDAASSTYALDADKEFDTETILSMLGKSMEKLLVLPKDQFERYHLDRSHEITEAERNSREGYNYTGFGQFLVRSQLDAHDPRLPGRGIFDIKTRAALGVRMNMEEPEVGQPYEIVNHHGQWDSFEREYVDMVRSAFLKYSLQVRMGGMDGIFCAFHNTKRIFGFQYIPLEEMDERIHGSSWQSDDPTQSVGHRELQHSFAMLEMLVEKATARFPNQTIRLHFETRDTVDPLMYFFAEPVTQQQMQSIQEATKVSATQSAERVMRRLEEMGHETAAGSPKKSDPVEWEELKEQIIASTQDGIDFLDDVALSLMTKHGLLDNHADGAIDKSTQALAQVLLDAVSVDEDGTLADDVSDVGLEYEVNSSAADTSEYESQEDDHAAFVPEATTGAADSGLLSEEEFASSENASETLDMDFEQSTETTEARTAESSSVNNGSLSEGESNGSGNTSEVIDIDSDQSTGMTEELTAKSPSVEEPTAPQTEESPVETAVNGSKPMKSLVESLEEALRGNIDNKKALADFVTAFEELRANRDSIQPEEDAGEENGEDKEANTQAQPEPDSSIPQLMGLAITVKHTVNGKPVERPEFPINSWNIDCTIKELKPESAQRIYRQLKNRRRATVRKDNHHQRSWRQSIQDSTDRGAAFRAGRDEYEATRTGMKVAWADEQVPKKAATSIFSTK